MSFLSEMDPNKFNEMVTQLEVDVQGVREMVSGISRSYTATLDEIMTKVYDQVICTEQPPLFVLEQCLFELANCLYYMGEKVERLGIYSSISKNAYKESYNTAYLNLTDVGDTKKKPTVAELTALSENQSMYENVMNDLYSIAYKIVKNKVEYATTMYNALNKIISRRMTEMQLSSVAPSGKQILMEDSPL